MSHSRCLPLLQMLKASIITRLYSMQGELILSMTYGYEVQGRNDRKIDAARRLTEIGSATALPGALLVNDLPFRV